MKNLLFLFPWIIYSIQSFGANDSLKISAIIQHINYAEDSLGKISVIVSGGSPPYSFQWSDNNADSASRDKLYSGNYELLVTDSQGKTCLNKYTILFNQIAETIRDSALTHIDTLRTIVYKNRINPHQDGFLEFLVDALNGDHTVGLSTDSIYSSLPDFGFYLNKSKLFLINERLISGSFGKLKKGDILRLQKQNGQINYIKNNIRIASYSCQDVLYRTVSVSSGPVARPPAILSSFNKSLHLNTTVIDLDCQRQTKGGLKNQVLGGIGPYTVRVYRGFELDNLNRIDPFNLEAGNYLTVVSDRAGNLKQVKSIIGYRIAWRVQSGFHTDSMSLKKTSDQGWCNSRVETNIDIKRDAPGWIEFEMSDTASRSFIGIRNMSGGSGSVIYQGVYADHKTLFAIETDQDGGFQKTIIKEFETPPKIKMSFENGLIKFSDGKGILHEEPLIINNSAKLQALIFEPETGLKSLRTSFNCER